MNHAPRISIIVAMARNRAIGLRGEIPWHIPDDLKRFKALTLGHPCIMGRKTFESIVARLGKPLPGRTSIVVSKKGFHYHDVPVFADVQKAIEAAKEFAIRDGRNEVFICGGAQIYAAALPLADKLYVTEVDGEPEADVFMPEWNPLQFRQVKLEPHDGDPPYSFIDFVRV